MAEYSEGDLGFLGQVMTAMVVDSQSITNSLIASLENQITELRKDFVEFFAAVDSANQRIDSARLGHILDTEYWKYENAVVKLEGAN